MNKHIEEAINFSKEADLYQLSEPARSQNNSLQSIASSLIAIAMMMEEQQSNKKDD